MPASVESQSQRRKDILAYFRICERQGKVTPNMREVAAVVGIAMETLQGHLRKLMFAGELEHFNSHPAYRLPDSHRLERALEDFVAWKRRSNLDVDLDQVNERENRLMARTWLAARGLDDSHS